MFELLIAISVFFYENANVCRCFKDILALINEAGKFFHQNSSYHTYIIILQKMKNSNRPYRKFLPQQKKIEELEKSSSRFKRIYSEYELMADELWNLESSETTESIPDDFINAIKLQTSYLEDEIEDWLIETPNKH